MTFVGVKEPSTPFVLRYSASNATPDNVYAVKFYIDGQTDHLMYPLSNSSPRLTKGLLNAAADKINLFSFGVSLWVESESESEDSSQVPTAPPALCGGPGIITAVFFPRGNPKPSLPQMNSVQKDSVQRPLKETKEHRELKLSVAYSGYEPFKRSSSTVRYNYGTPVAMLNLHYRATSVLRARGHLLLEQKYPMTRETREIDDSRGGPSSAVPPPKVIQELEIGSTSKAETKDSETDILSTRTRKRIKTEPRDYRKEKKVKPEVVVIDSGDEEDGKVVYID